MKDHELKAIDLALAEFPREVRIHAPLMTAAVKTAYATSAEADFGPSNGTVEAWVDNLTTREALEVAYRLLGRLLENVSSWRRLLRWAIGKVMELLAGAKERV